MSQIAVVNHPRLAPARLVAVLTAALAASACSVGPGRLTLPRTATEQILVTDSIERALDELEWPTFDGEFVVVHTAAPGVELDENYLRRSAEKRLAAQGARVTQDEDDADYVLTTLAGAIGIDRSRRFFGLMGVTGGIIPLTIPELALFSHSRSEGYARTEIVLSDARKGGVVHRSGPTRAETFSWSRVILFFFTSRDTNSTRRLPKQ